MDWTIQKNLDLVRILCENCVKTGDFHLSSGIKSGIFVDMSTVFNDSRLLNPVLSYFYRFIPDHEGFEYIGGESTGAIPLITGFLMRENFKSRLDDHPQRKGFWYNKDKGTFEGELPRMRTEYILVDDVVTTGKSVLNIIDNLDAGLCNGVFCIVDREQGAKEKIRKRGIPLVSCCTLSDIEHYMRRNYER